MKRISRKYMTPEQKAEHNRQRCRDWRAANLDRARANKRTYMAKRRAEEPEKIYEEKKRWADANRPHLSRKWRERQRRKKALTRKGEQQLIDRAHAVIPRALPKYIRDEVFNMLILAVYEGRFSTRLKPDDAKAVMKEHFKQFSNYDQTLSLDARRFHDGKSTLHDTVREGMWQ